MTIPALQQVVELSDHTLSKTRKTREEDNPGFQNGKR
jgi:hypothetical protein